MADVEAVSASVAFVLAVSPVTTDAAADDDIGVGCDTTGTTNDCNVFFESIISPFGNINGVVLF